MSYSVNVFYYVRNNARTNQSEQVRTLEENVLYPAEMYIGLKSNRNHWLIT